MTSKKSCKGTLLFKPTRIGIKITMVISLCCCVTAEAAYGLMNVGKPKGIERNYSFENGSAARPVCDVRALGADPTFHRDSTAAINNAIAICSNVGGITFFPPGTYKVIPALQDNGAVAAIGAFRMISKMHIVGAKGATLKLANNQSTDANPRNLSMFFTNAGLKDVRFDCQGLAMDMNGAHNSISPNRPVTYQNSFDMAMIHVSGDMAHVDDMLIRGCQFLNTPGVSAVVAGESNTAGIILGKRWVVANNLFENNGTDSSDHTSFYGWAEGIDFYDNACWEDFQYAVVGKTGGVTCFEVHGANSNYHDNLVYQYYRGAFLANNYTSVVTNADVHDNTFVTMFVGVDVFNANATGGWKANKIRDNSCRFDDSTFWGGASEQDLHQCDTGPEHLGRAD